MDQAAHWTSHVLTFVV
jgi:chromosome partitioning protein